MANAPAHASWTFRDFVALDEDDRRELFDGQLLEVDVPTKLHEHIIFMLVVFLGSWARPRNAGVGLVSGFKLKVSESRGVMPDVQFFRRGNPAAAGDATALEEGHPDLVVEVISGSSARYDRIIKLEYYAAIGVPEYWIVDPSARSVERLVLQGTKYLIAQTATEDQTFRPESFEELEIPLGELWTLA